MVKHTHRFKDWISVIQQRWNDCNKLEQRLSKSQKRQLEKGLQAARWRHSARIEWETMAWHHSSSRRERGEARSGWDSRTWCFPGSWNEGPSRDWAWWRLDGWGVGRPKRKEGEWGETIETNWSRDKNDNLRRCCRLQDRGAVQGRSERRRRGIAHRHGGREARLARGGIREHDAFLGHEMRGPAGTRRGGVSMPVAGGREGQSARNGNGVRGHRLPSPPCFVHNLLKYFGFLFRWERMLANTLSVYSYIWIYSYIYFTFVSFYLFYCHI